MYRILIALQAPGNLVNDAINAAILYSLLSHIAFIRIAGVVTKICFKDFHRLVDSDKYQ